MDRGFNRVYTPGANTKMSNFAAVIRCADGAVGEYATLFGGRKSHVGQLEAVGKDGSYPVPSGAALGGAINWEVVKRNRASRLRVSVGQQ